MVRVHLMERAWAHMVAHGAELEEGEQLQPLDAMGETRDEGLVTRPQSLQLAVQPEVESAAAFE